MTRDRLACGASIAHLRSAQNAAMSSVTSDGATNADQVKWSKTCTTPTLALQKSHFISSMGAAVRRFMRNQANTPLIPNGRNYSVEAIRAEAVRIASLAFCFSCRAKHTFEELFSTPLIGNTEADTANFAAEHQRLATRLRQELDVVHRSTFALMSAAENLGVEVSFTVSHPGTTEFEHYNYHPLPPSPNRAVGNFPNVHGENLSDMHGEVPPDH